MRIPGMKIAGSYPTPQEAGMRTNMHMTIQDYFKQSGHHSQSVHRGHGPNADPRKNDPTFTKILDSKQSSNNTRQRGLSIRDYLAKPVRTRPPIPPIQAGPVHQIGSSNPIGQTPVVDHVVAPAVFTPDEASPIDVDKGKGSPTTVFDQIDASIERAANRYNLPKALIRAVVKAESGFQVRAVSPAGAQGLMQLMPTTAKELGVTDPFDIEQNIDGGVKYLRAMMDRFNGDVRLALSAYNAGPGTVAKYDGQVPYVETRNYVQRVLRFARRST